MNTKLVPFLVLLLSLTAFGVYAAETTEGGDNKSNVVDLKDYTCRDILLADGNNRELSIMFLQGFFLGKSGDSKFNEARLGELTDNFLDACLGSPDASAIDTFGHALEKMSSN